VLVKTSRQTLLKGKTMGTSCTHSLVVVTFFVLIVNIVFALLHGMTQPMLRFRNSLTVEVPVPAATFPMLLTHFARSPQGSTSVTLMSR